MVTEENKPSEAAIKYYQKINLYESYCGFNTPQDWYCLLRNAQGSVLLKLILSDNLKHLLDGSDFILDSRSCEHAYIINFDDNCLDYYKGSQQQPQKNNRFGTKLDEGYYPCALKEKIPFLKTGINLKLIENLELINN